MAELPIEIIGFGQPGLMGETPDSDHKILLVAWISSCAQERQKLHDDMVAQGMEGRWSELSEGHNWRRER